MKEKDCELCSNTGIDNSTIMKEPCDGWQKHDGGPCYYGELMKIWRWREQMTEHYDKFHKYSKLIGDTEQLAVVERINKRDGYDG